MCLPFAQNRAKRNATKTLLQEKTKLIKKGKLDKQSASIPIYKVNIYKKRATFTQIYEFLCHFHTST